MVPCCPFLFLGGCKNKKSVQESFFPQERWSTNVSMAPLPAPWKSGAKIWENSRQIQCFQSEVYLHTCPCLEDHPMNNNWLVTGMTHCILSNVNNRNSHVLYLRLVHPRYFNVGSPNPEWRLARSDHQDY